MLSNDLQQVIMLNPVHINYDLAKWNSDQLKDKSWDKANLGMMVEGGRSNSFFATNGNPNVWDGISFPVRNRFNSEWLRMLAGAYIRFRMVFTMPKKDPVKFFMEVKDNFEELEKTDVSDEKIQELLFTLENSRQKFAVATIINQQSIKKLENSLVEAGFTQYQTEESLIKFIKGVKKGLCLTELEYFDRPIPEDVMAKVDKAEQTKVFDNYYILYHDPKKADNKYFIEEKLKPKDPIIFGVIKGSTKMYYVADWIDEFCNLTYKDILAKGTDFKLKNVAEE